MNVFRTGSHVGRTIYVQAGDGASKRDDMLIGVMDTRELADFAVRAMNEAVHQGWRLPHTDGGADASAPDAPV